MGKATPSKHKLPLKPKKLKKKLKDPAKQKEREERYAKELKAQAAGCCPWHLEDCEWARWRRQKRAQRAEAEPKWRASARGERVRAPSPHLEP